MTCRQTRRRRRGRRWWVAPTAGGSALVAVAAWGILAHRPNLPGSGPEPQWAQVVQAAGAPAAAPSGPAGGRLHPRTPLRSPAMPAVLPVGAESIQIPSLRISAAAEPESVTAGALGVPADPAEVGWWMPSTAELVIDGHVDVAGIGPGALYDVRDLRPGAVASIQTADGPERWQIDGVRTYPKGSLPAGLLRWNGTQPRLVIITCGGPFDYATHHYYDNVTAYGTLLRS